MGLLASEIVQFLQIAEKRGIEGKTLAMMGKQYISLEMDPFLSIIRELGYPYDRALAERISSQKEIDSCDFFKMLGFQEVHAVDYSEYEGADIIFDLNDPLPDSLKGSFDYVINGGTLEHVFDIAKAMENMSGMVKEGGLIMHLSPSDGWINHGFYSISPTFFQDYYSTNSFFVKLLELEFLICQGTKNKGPYVTFFSDDLRIFRTPEQLDSYIASLKAVKNADQIALICFAEKAGGEKPVKYPNQGAYQNMKRIDFKKAADEIKRSGAALYGCGSVCDQLLDELYRIDGERAVTNIFDGNIRKAGTGHRGYAVLYPTAEKLAACGEIYICSTTYENEIKKELLEKGIPARSIKKLSGFLWKDQR